MQGSFNVLWPGCGRLLGTELNSTITPDQMVILCWLELCVGPNPTEQVSVGCWNVDGSALSKKTPMGKYVGELGSVWSAYLAALKIQDGTKLCQEP